MSPRLAILAVLGAVFVFGGAPVSAASPVPVPSLAQVGAPIGDAPPASVFAPSQFRATFRVPRIDTALYIGTQWQVRDLQVTIVGPGPRRQTLVADASLPGHMLGVRLPGDAWQADRLELSATTVSNVGRPYVIKAETLAKIGWRNWWYSAFFGLFLGLCLMHTLLALTMRSRAFGWYSLAMAMEAALMIAWLGIVRPPPEISQPVNAVIQSVLMIAILMFSLAYLRSARIGRNATIGLWVIVGLNVASAFGSDLFQDRWPVPDPVTQATISVMGLGFVLLGVTGVLRGVDGARYYVAGTTLSVGGYLIGTLDSPLYNPLVQSAPMVGTGLEALLLAVALSVQLRRQEREREHLGRLAHVDGLTGVANRAALDTQLARNWERARKASAPLAALMIDVDYFKTYNDAYGHQAGDDVLRRIAGVLSQRAARRDDVVARYGGEEFLVLLYETDLAGAQRVADDMLKGIADLAVPHETTPERRVTVSIGVASLIPDHDGDGSELVRRADAALYLAKARGRNRLEVDEPVAVA